jgi:hypothetical protein
VNCTSTAEAARGGSGVEAIRTASVSFGGAAFKEYIFSLNNNLAFSILSFAVNLGPTSTTDSASDVQVSQLRVR